MTCFLVVVFCLISYICCVLFDFVFVFLSPDTRFDKFVDQVGHMRITTHTPNHIPAVAHQIPAVDSKIPAVAPEFPQ